MKKNLTRLTLMLVVSLFVSLGLILSVTPDVYSSEGADEEIASGIGRGKRCPRIPWKAYHIADYFPCEQGDTWEYKVFSDDGEENQGRVKIDGTEIVNGVETKKRYELLDPDWQDENWYECVAQNSEGFVWYKEVDIKQDPSDKFYNPPYVYLPLKMRIGQSFTSYWLEARPIADPSTAIRGCTIRLEGLETVSVPAGRFEGCLKIKYCEFWHEENPSYHDAWKGWMWLARGVGIVKIVEYGVKDLPDGQKTETDIETIELISYKINNEIN